MFQGLGLRLVIIVLGALSLYAYASSITPCSRSFGIEYIAFAIRKPIRVLYHNFLQYPLPDNVAPKCISLRLS